MKLRVEMSSNFGIYSVLSVWVGGCKDKINLVLLIKIVHHTTDIIYYIQFMHMINKFLKVIAIVM